MQYDEFVSKINELNAEIRILKRPGASFARTNLELKRAELIRNNQEFNRKMKSGR